MTETETPAPDGLEIDAVDRDMIARGDRIGANLARQLLSYHDQAQSLIAELRGERDEADNSLVDKYRDPKTGHFSFPGDVAAIVRRLEAAEARLREAEEALTKIAAADEFAPTTDLIRIAGAYRRAFLKGYSNSRDQFECPINQPGCTKDCGSYGCGN